MNCQILKPDLDGSVGDCARDTFVVSSGGASFRGSPVICGANTGQHCKY